MGTRIATSSESFGKAADKSWLAARDGLDVMRSITVDPALFAAAHIAGGFIPSGTPLGGPTVDDTYGPYDATAEDGTENPAGLLFEEAKVTSLTDPKFGAALFWRGIVRRDKLPQFDGTVVGEIDTAFETGATHIRFER